MSSEATTIDHGAIDQTAALAAAAPDEHHHVAASVKVEDPLANLEAEGEAGVDREQAALDAGEEAAAAAMEAAAAAEAAEACLGNVLDDVAGVPAPLPAPLDDGKAAEDDDVALAAAAAAAAVQAADGMAVVVDQALLATAAAAAASQVAEVLGDHTADHGMHVPQDGAPPPLPNVMSASTQHILAGRSPGEGDLLHHRREKDRKRYSAMTPEARASYNAHRRELYHKQGESARKRRRERERDRYHALEGEAKKIRNERRAKLERDRYNRLSKDELSIRNARRRERAKQRKLQAKAAPAAVPTEEAAAIAATTIPPPPQPGMGVKADPDNMAGEPLPEATVDVADAHAMADASALAAEVAEQVIAGTNLEGAMEAVNGAASVMAEDGPTVQI